MFAFENGLRIEDRVFELECFPVGRGWPSSLTGKGPFDVNIIAPLVDDGLEAVLIQPADQIPGYPPALKAKPAASVVAA